jgi:hypothetical protein
VYAKSLRLASWSFDQHATQHKSNNDSHKEESNGSANNVVPSSITNLMSEDPYNVMSCVWIGHYVWAIPLKVYFLNIEVGNINIIGFNYLDWSHHVSAAQEVRMERSY